MSNISKVMLLLIISVTFSSVFTIIQYRENINYEKYISFNIKSSIVQISSNLQKLSVGDQDNDPILESVIKKRMLSSDQIHSISKLFLQISQDIRNLDDINKYINENSIDNEPTITFMMNLYHIFDNLSYQQNDIKLTDKEIEFIDNLNQIIKEFSNIYKDIPIRSNSEYSYTRYYEEFWDTAVNDQFWTDILVAMEELSNEHYDIIKKMQFKNEYNNQSTSDSKRISFTVSLKGILSKHY